MHTTVSSADWYPTNQTLQFNLDDGYRLLLVLTHPEKGDSRVYEVAIRLNRGPDSGAVGLAPLVAKLYWVTRGPQLIVAEGKSYSADLLRRHLEAAKSASPTLEQHVRLTAVPLFDHDWPRLDETLTQLAA